MPPRDSGKRRTQLPDADDFKSVAKRLECDEDKGQFEAKLGKIAKAKPNRPSEENKAGWHKRGLKSK